MSGRVGQGRPLRPQTAGFMVPAAAEATQGDAAPSCPAPIPAAASGSATKRTAGGGALRRPAHARPLQPAAPRPSARLPPRAAPNKSRGKAVRVRLRGSAAAAPVASAVRPLPLKGDAPTSPAPPEAALLQRSVPRHAVALCHSFLLREPLQLPGSSGAPRGHAATPRAGPKRPAPRCRPRVSARVPREQREESAEFARRGGSPPRPLAAAPCAFPKER